MCERHGFALQKPPKVTALGFKIQSWRRYVRVCSHFNQIISTAQRCAARLVSSTASHIYIHPFSGNKRSDCQDVMSSDSERCFHVVNLVSRWFHITWSGGKKKCFTVGEEEKRRCDFTNTDGNIATMGLIY